MNILGKIAKTFSEKVAAVALAFGVTLVWVTLVSHFLKGIYQLDSELLPKIFFTCIFAPLWEELAFRVAPIKLAINFGPNYIWPIVIISSILFGALHGHGDYSILIQGFMGFMWSWLYLKTNNNYWACVIVHAMWNTFCLMYL